MTLIYENLNMLQKRIEKVDQILAQLEAERESNVITNELTEQSDLEELHVREYIQRLSAERRQIEAETEVEISTLNQTLDELKVMEDEINYIIQKMSLDI
jgi:septal ring factor EnvC (AmiA/AmiB activator)